MALALLLNDKPVLLIIYEEGQTGCFVSYALNPPASTQLDSKMLK